MVAMTPLPNLSVTQLQYLVAVAESGSWADAASALGVSQSALSQGLAQLQRRIGVELFERDGRRQVMAAHAQPVLDHARRVLATTADLVEWADRHRRGAVGRLRVGMIDAAAVDHFPQHLRRYRQRYPEVELHLTVAPSSQLLTALRQGHIDVAVCVEGQQDTLPTTPLIDEPLLVYPTPGAAEHRTRTPSWGPWVTFPVGSLTRSLIENALTRRGVDIEVVAESHQPEVLKEMVALGLGWTVLPRQQAERDPTPLQAIEPTPLLTRRIVATTRPATTNPAVTALVGALTNHA